MSGTGSAMPREPRRTYKYAADRDGQHDGNKNIDLMIKAIKIFISRCRDTDGIIILTPL